MPEGELEPLLAALLRKEVLAIQADPRSPERGQYAFLQDIVKRVAYETVSKRERKAKHLAAAEFLSSTWGAEEDEIAEVVATHFLDAYEAAPDEDLAALAAQIGRFRFFAGDPDVAMQRVETALEIAEALLLPEVLSQALNTKALILVNRGRSTEGLVLMRYALDIALDHDKASSALRAYYNLADTVSRADRYEEAAQVVQDGLVLARRIGNRWWEWQLLGQTYPSFALGNWDEVLALTAEIPEEQWSQARQSTGALVNVGVAVSVHRGKLDEAAQIMATFSDLETSADEQERGAYASGKSRLLLGQGNAEEALRVAEAAFAGHDAMGMTAEQIKEAFVTAV